MTCDDLPRPSEEGGVLIAPAISFHITQACNTNCRFCFATFRDIRSRSRKEDTLQIIRDLAKVGVRKITFAGGEPTLHPDLLSGDRAPLDLWYQRFFVAQEE